MTQTPDRPAGAVTAEEIRKPLAAYRALFDDGEMSAATMVRAKRPSLDPPTGQSDEGTAEGQGTSGFEDQATEAVAPRRSRVRPCQWSRRLAAGVAVSNIRLPQASSCCRPSGSCSASSSP